MYILPTISYLTLSWGVGVGKFTHSYRFFEKKWKTTQAEGLRFLDFYYTSFLHVVSNFQGQVTPPSEIMGGFPARSSYFRIPFGIKLILHDFRLSDANDLKIGHK